MDNTNRDWMTEGEIDAFVGKNSGFYKREWKEHPNSKYFKGWNVIAIFFFPEWAVYRKMYKEALLPFLAILIFEILFSIIPIGAVYKNGLRGLGRLVIRIFFGFLANGLYHRKALRMVSKSSSMADAARMEYLAKKGGTNIIGVFVCVILEIMLVVLVIALVALMIYLIFLFFGLLFDIIGSIQG